MHLTIRSNHAMRLLMYCGLNHGRITPAAEIARACNSSEAHLGKIANWLAQHGYVETVRGRGGGVRLMRAPEEISVGEIVRGTETGSCIVECHAIETNTCPLRDACKFRDVLAEAMAAFLAVLDRFTLADLIEDGDDLRRLMGLEVHQPQLRAAV
jgi:Rrf2 family nitric oxide-sensitive transcriptional repressor